MVCTYIEPWIGLCGAESGNSNRCEKHDVVCRVCGKLATHGCAETRGPAVCGIPLCPECRCPCLQHNYFGADTEIAWRGSALEARVRAEISKLPKQPDGRVVVDVPCYSEPRVVLEGRSYRIESEPTGKLYQMLVYPDQLFTVLHEAGTGTLAEYFDRQVQETLEACKRLLAMPAIGGIT